MVYDFSLPFVGVQCSGWRFLHQTLGLNCLKLHWYTNRYGCMVEQDRPNLISNGLCDSMVETAQHISFSLSIPNTECYIPNGRTASASQWAPGKASGRKGYCNSRVAWLNTSTFPLLKPVSFGCIVWQPVRLRRTGPTEWGLNSPLRHVRNCLCISAFQLVLVVTTPCHG